MKPAATATTTRCLLAAALSLLTTVLCLHTRATPLDTRGIPATATGVIHLDYDLFAKSSLNAAAKQLSEKNITAQNGASLADIQKQTGLNPDTDIHSITIGLIKPPAGDSTEPQPTIVIRGAFTPDKLIEFAKQTKCTITTRGPMTIIASPDKATLAAAARNSPSSPANPMAGMMGMINMGATPGMDDSDSTPSQPYYAALVGNNTILVAPNLDAIDKSSAALTGAAYTPPAAFTTFTRQQGTPMLTAYIDKDLVANAGGGMMPTGDIKNIQISLAETSSRLRAHILSEYATPDAAAKTKSMIQGLLGFLQMGAAGADTPEAAARAEKIQRLLSALKFTQTGPTLDISLDLPAEDATALMK